MQLFIISFLVLFLELAFIRFLPAYVKLLGYFANAILLASFLGMSVGCLAAQKKRSFINAVPPLLVLVMVLTTVIYAMMRLEVANISLSPEIGKSIVYFGAENTTPNQFHLPLELVLSVIFFIVATIFVGLGQMLGRAFDRYPPLSAYIINLLGSIVGIVVFTTMSALSLPPLWWFALAFLLLGGWLRGEWWKFATRMTCLALSLLIVIILDIGTPPPGGTTGVIWSPYYKVRYFTTSGNDAGLYIWVNEIGHQYTSNVAKTTTLYTVPYALLQHTRKPVREALIIGAGSGNDAAAALQHGVQHVDAVEIDPSIIKLGQRYHPNKPYQDPRVSLTNDDGRSYLRKNHRHYDMVVYALVDSLTLMSTFSSVRLETYLFTRDAFKDVKAHLNDDGTFVIYNYFREPWLALRLAQMLKEVFGQEPLVFTFPPAPSLSEASQTSVSMFSLFMVGNIEPLRRHFQQNEAFLLKTQDPLFKEGPGRFTTTTTPYDDLSEKKILPTSLVMPDRMSLPSDDWPFLYLRNPSIPPYLLRCMALIILISLFILWAFCKGDLKGRLSLHFFFLGAAFMLLETRSVISLALLFGSTWRVNSIVFFFILVMILVANLYILKRPAKDYRVLYALLVGSLLMNFLLPPQAFLGLNSFLKLILPPVIIFLPILFAALVFGNSFRNSKQPSTDLGWNTAGVLVGGLCENFSLIIGYRALLILAICFYLLSAFTKTREKL